MITKEQRKERHIDIANGGCVEWYWDSWSRIWIIQKRDAEDNQIGDANFAANVGTLDHEIESII